MKAGKWLASLSTNLVPRVVLAAKIAVVIILGVILMAAAIVLGAVTTSFLVDFGHFLRMYL